MMDIKIQNPFLNTMAAILILLLSINLGIHAVFGPDIMTNMLGEGSVWLRIFYFLAALSGVYILGKKSSDKT